ncbi:MAG: DAHL domain-containing protein [Chloroflexota bacterium]
MPKPVRLIDITVSVIFVAILVLLFMRAQAIDAEEHASYSSSLRQVEALDARLNDSVLQVRLGLIDFYDTPNTLLVQMKNEIEVLKAIPEWIDNTHAVRINNALQIYTSEVASKEELLNEFTTTNAVLNNSVAFFPGLVNDITEMAVEEGVPPTDVALLNRFAQTVLVFEQNTDTDLIPLIESNLDYLRQNADVYPSSDRSILSDIEIALNHATIIVERKPIADDLLSAALQVNTADVSEEMRALYAFAYNDALNRERRSQTLLSVYIAAMIMTLSGRIIVGMRRTATQLDAARMRYEGIFNNATEGIFQVDFDTDRFISANPAMARILGYNSPEAMIADIGSIPEQLYIDPAAYEELKQRLQQTGAVTNRESQIRRRDGRIIWVTENVRLVCDEDGDPLYYDGVSSDITHQIELEQQSRTLYELSKKLTTAVGADHLLATIARTVEGYGVKYALLIYNASEVDTIETMSWVIASKWKRHAEHDFNSDVIGGVSAAFLQQQSLIPLIQQPGDDDLGYLAGLKAAAAAILPMYHHNHWLGTIVLLWDQPHPFTIAESDLYRALPTLAAPVVANRQLVLNLESRVQERTEEIAVKNEQLQQSMEAAQAANHAKSVFLANMSHELRTPLNAILGFSQLMRNDRGLSAVHQDHVHIINTSGEALLDLINDVLDLSKIEAGQMILNESGFNVYQLIKQLKDLMTPRAVRKKLHFRTHIASDVPEHLIADTGKLRQILLNLVGNAIKFTEAGDVDLFVSVRHVEPDICLLAIRVQDTGVGIGHHELDSLFDAFTQTRSGQSHQEGSGLGLAITKQFVDLMDGDISVESEVGAGTTFTVEFPVKIGDETAEIEPEFNFPLSLAAGEPGYRILVVEDQPQNRQLLREILQPLGFDVREAVNGHEGVTIAQEWKPDLIFMDMRMPIMDGYEAAGIIATDEETTPVIIALTASAFEHERQAILDAGCDDFIRKPFRNRELIGMLEQHLSVRFVYEEPEQDTPGDAEADENNLTLDTVSDEWREALKSAANSADYDMMLHLVNQLEDERIARYLLQLINDFAFERLIDLADTTA